MVVVIEKVVMMIDFILDNLMNVDVLSVDVYEFL